MTQPIPERLNADRSLPAVVHSADLPWVPSPAGGVERRFLERVGGEVAVASTIVRFAPGSAFPEHLHEMGEEYLVLEGVFSDGDGDFPVGAYVRNPSGSRHAPHTDPGCTIFVKLRQMAPAGEPLVRRLTAGETFAATAIPGLTRLSLHEAAESVALERLAPGATLPADRAPRGEEILVLEGGLEGRLDGAPLLARPGSWLRFPPGAAPELSSANGCRYWVKRGHIPG